MQVLTKDMGNLSLHLWCDTDFMCVFG